MAVDTIVASMATMHMVAMTDAITGAREDSILDGNYQLSNSIRS